MNVTVSNVLCDDLEIYRQFSSLIPEFYSADVGLTFQGVLACAGLALAFLGAPLFPCNSTVDGCP